MLTITKEDRLVPEDGEYLAVLKNIDEVTSKAHPEYGPSLRFSFTLLEDPYMNYPVTGLVSPTWQPGNKLDKWLQGLGVDGANVGETLRLPDLVGIQARVFVETGANGFTNVKKIMRLHATTPRTVPAPAKPVVVAQPAPAVEAPAPVVEVPVTPAPVQPVVQPTIRPQVRKTIPF